MNIIRLLLIGGLVYFAMQQKKEGNRNMILIVTGLLAVCMLSKEGFTVDLTTPVTCTGNVTTQDEVVTVDESCAAIEDNAADVVTCGEVALPSDQVTCAAKDGGGKCTYTAAVTGQAAVTRPCSIEEDLSNDVCQNECVRSGGDTMDTYFTSESLTSLGLTYNGTGDVDINTPEVLASQFTCSDGNAPTLKTGTLPDIPANADPPLDLTTYLQCPTASPSPSPSPSPPARGSSAPSGSDDGPSAWDEFVIWQDVGDSLGGYGNVVKWFFIAIACVVVGGLVSRGRGGTPAPKSPG